MYPRCHLVFRLIIAPYHYRTIRYLHDRKEYEYRWVDALQHIDIPCLLLWGDHDSVAPLAIASELHAKAPACKVKVMNGFGHFVMLEAPQLWLEAVRDFMLR
jgi:pimeloyl-ACP methyl ester carboxylesterase